MSKAIEMALNFSSSHLHKSFPHKQTTKRQNQNNIGPKPAVLD